MLFGLLRKEGAILVIVCVLFGLTAQDSMVLLIPSHSSSWGIAEYRHATLNTPTTTDTSLALARRLTSPPPPALPPITISSDAGFLSTGFVGSGTATDPYVLQYVDVWSSTQVAVSISNTRTFFVIKGCRLQGTTCLKLNNVSNARIESDFIGYYSGSTNQVGGGIFGTYLYNSTLFGNEASNVGGSSLNFGYLTNVTIANSYIHNGAGIALYVGSSQNCTISGTNISGNNVEFFYFDGLNNCRIVQNSIYSGYVFGRQPITVKNSQNLTISGNLISQSRAQGIYLAGSVSNSKILNNTVFGCRSEGIYVSQSSNNTICYNLFHDNGDYYSLTEAYEASSVNIWDDGIALGNWWDDYSGNGTYVIPGPSDGVDRFPRMYDVTPPTLTSPPDLRCNEGTTGNSIVWIASDQHLRDYRVLEDGQRYASGPLNGTTCGIRIYVDGLGLGVYNFTCVVWDLMNLTKSDTVLVTVVDETKPLVDSPSDVAAEVGTSGNCITWSPSDLHPSSYGIQRNGSTFASGSWNGSKITVSIDSFSVGVYNLTLVVWDVAGNWASDQVIGTVVDTMAPVWVEPPADRLIEYGNSLFCDMNATDYSGIQAWWLNDTTHFAIDGAGVITNLTALPIGAYWVEVRAYDPYNHYCTTTLQVTVQDTMAPTWMQLPANRTVEFGNGFRYDVNASDPSGIDHYWVNSSAFAIDGAGVITNLTALPIGAYWVEVRAYDPHGRYCNVTFSVTVQDTLPPMWMPLPTDQVVEFPGGFRYDLNATDPSGIDYYWINDTVHFAIDSAGVITNATSLLVGVYWLEVRAYDPYTNYCTATFRIVVQDTTDPTWDQLPTNQLFELGPSFAYNLNASDASGISQWWTNDTTHFTIDGTGLITSMGIVPAGAYGLEVRAYDPYARLCSATFVVIIQDTVSPTWDQPPTDQVVEFGAVLRYDVNASDLAGMSLWWLNDTIRFQIDAAGVITNHTSLTVGKYHIQVRAYDPSINYRQATLQLTVRDTTPPTWTILPTNQVLEPGTSLDYQLLAADLSGVSRWAINDTEHFQVSNTGRITSVGSLAPGEYALLVSAYDPYDNALDATFTVVALPPISTPPIPGFPWSGVLLAWVAAVALSVLRRRRRA